MPLAGGGRQQPIPPSLLLITNTPRGTLPDRSSREISNTTNSILIRPAVPKFPLSSPMNDDQLLFQSANIDSAVTSEVPHEPLATSRGPSIDDGSDGTSDQDEFHLERYSEGFTWDGERPGSRSRYPATRNTKQDSDRSSRKRPRPGLAIITDFSKLNSRSKTDGLIVQRVQAQRPQIGQRAITTSRFQEGEYGQYDAGSEVGPSSEFVKLKDLARLRKRISEEIPLPDANATSWPSGIRSNDRLANPGSRSRKNFDRLDEMESAPFERRPRNLGDLIRAGIRKQQNAGSEMTATTLRPPEPRLKEISPSDRSIVIGISVPEDEAESHKPHPELDSALTLQTPLTPTILITPADPTAAWAPRIEYPESNGKKRPASSVYSQATAINRSAIFNDKPPPMPSLPRQHQATTGPSQKDDVNKRINSWEHDSTQRQRALSSGTIFDADESPDTLNRPRSISAEASNGLVASATTTRPRSKGWWNLALSPLLSRAGTLVNRKSSNGPENVPPIPNIPGVPPNEDYDFLLGEKVRAAFSPDTPRRIGMVNSRANTWSRWSDWERDREDAISPSGSEESFESVTIRGHKAQESSVTVPFMMGPTPVAEGLAKEYFLACAMELRMGTPFFECQNHSCAERLPELVSIYDEGMKDSSDNKSLHRVTKWSPDGLLIATHGEQESHVRSNSNSTIIEDEPTELSPHVREADTAPILRAKSVVQEDNPARDLGREEEPESTTVIADDASTAQKTPAPTILPPSHPPATFNNFIHVMPFNPHVAPISPGPMSAEMQRAMTAQGAFPMNEIPAPPPVAPQPVFIKMASGYPDLRPQTRSGPMSMTEVPRSPSLARSFHTVHPRLQDGKFSETLGRGSLRWTKTRMWAVVIIAILSLLVIVCVVLATQLTRKGDQTPVQSQWLNLTGFPPLPTGISTIARPDVAVANSGCVQPSTLWSCAVPKEDQAGIAPNDPDQPNFRIEIRFRNGTVPANETLLASKLTANRQSSLLRRQNDPFTNDLFTPNPAAPSLAEQEFMGNTTDKITVPFEGEVTPFYMTFLPTDPILPAAFNSTSDISRRLRSRQNANSLTSSNLTGNIPAPSLGADLGAAPANLLPNNPFPFSQPIRLFNRAQSTEHYGFYTYFDRSIFLESETPLNATDAASGDGIMPEDENGGSNKSEANLACTWSQTRFLVRIWTNPSFGGTLLAQSSNNTTGSVSSGPSNELGNAVNSIANSSATDFSRPGSFPYPVSITLDRHGGDGAKKALYCYGVSGGEIQENVKSLVQEIRGLGGELINAVPALHNSPSDGSDDGIGFNASAGGVDGGTGGCSCEWRSWAGNLNGTP